MFTAFPRSGKRAHCKRRDATPEQDRATDKFCVPTRDSTTRKCSGACQAGTVTLRPQTHFACITVGRQSAIRAGSAQQRKSTKTQKAFPQDGECLRRSRSWRHSKLCRSYEPRPGSTLRYPRSSWGCRLTRPTSSDSRSTPTRHYAVTLKPGSRGQSVRIRPAKCPTFCLRTRSPRSRSVPACC